jgi:hypothetical protein
MQEKKKETLKLTLLLNRAEVIQREMKRLE